MSGKAKPQKHTAKEIAQKHHEAKMRAGGRGGGEEGKEKRKAPKEDWEGIKDTYQSMIDSNVEEAAKQREQKKGK